ncbi:MBL fold metallo-hydrolase [Alkalicoccus halolimnae]|uniref:MBL fold metallo-hydrolase n=1 Tax=Alkalicoccus halolimnae TaxID=1667239 RepID=A0A5C7FEY9_9BACI|nr:MBL fold metallo-hydrolase [Alkalicoccus halolimnae]TXF82743.1 MBL fold metallo-hydrolase [Alkalicoccus halolimnae]
MYLKYFYDNKLAQASYMVGCQKTGEAAVIDPSRQVDEYTAAAEEQGFTITAALETHIHADYVSGSRELSSRTGAVIYHSVEGAENGGYDFPDEEKTKGMKEGDKIEVGNTWMEVLHTPGHTPEHVSFLLTDGANPDKPIGIFTGDFVFVGDVGRPDLLEKSVGVKDSAKEGAEQMFASLKKFKQLDDYLQIWPGHGAGSSCGKALGAVPTSTVGYEKLFNPALQPDKEEEFIDFLLDGQPEPPSYFGKMKEINVGRVPLLSSIEQPVRYSYNAGQIEKLAEDKNVMVVDTRSPAAYAGGSAEGTVNIALEGPFLEWMGWLADYEADLYFITEEKDQQDILQALAKIGLDNVKGFFSPKTLKGSGLRTYENVSASDLSEKDSIQVADVRFDDEWKTAHIPGAVHIKLNELQKKGEKKLSKDKPVAVHCETGVRSAIAASILLNQGFDVKNLQHGFQEWKKAELAVTS